MLTLEVHSNEYLTIEVEVDSDHLNKKQRKGIKRVRKIAEHAIAYLNARFSFSKDFRKMPKEEDYEKENRVYEVNMGDYNSKGMRIYGANVGLMRAVPDIMDGFKPLERRILYATAFIAKALKTQKKYLAIIGCVIHIHPHGDASVGECMATMAQEWENLYPLFEVKGNKGQPSGEREAAPRYLQGRLSEYCQDCYFKDWDNNLIEMSPSYNPEFEEPNYLIPKFPNILVRPVTGFTFAASTNFPSFNLEESFNAMIELIKDPTYEPVLYPDMPSACTIVDDGSFPEICRTGLGTFKMKAVIEIDEEKHSLVVRSLPYHVGIKKIIDTISALKSSGDIPGLTGIHDGSNVYGINLRISCSHDVNLRDVMNLLYKKTALQSTFATKMQFVDNYELKVFGLKQIMLKWIDTRRTMKHKWANYRSVYLKSRVHILTALIDITSSEKNSVEMIKLIRTSKTDDIIKTILKKYDYLTSLQAKEISELKVKNFAVDRQEKYKKDLQDANEEIEYLEGLLDKPKKIDKLIIKEIKEAIDKYTMPRRCKIEKAVAEEDLISNDDFYLIFTMKDMVKKIGVNTTSIGKLNDGDNPIQAVKVNNRDKIVFFDRTGYIHTVKVSDILQNDLKSHGTAIGRYANAKDGVIMAIPLSQIDTEKGQFVFVTEQGLIKKTPCNKYAFKTSIISIVLKGDDRLASVIYTDGDKDIIVYTRFGVGTRFNTQSFTETSRMSSGVIAMDIPEGDNVMGVTVIGPKDTHIAMMTNKGSAKKCDLETFESGKRRGSVLKLITLGKGEELIQVLASKKKDLFRVVLKKDTCVIWHEDFPELTRNHPGKKLVAVPVGEHIVRFFKVTES